MPEYYMSRKKKAAENIGKMAERRTAKRIGARLQPNSGSMEGAKGDMSLGADFLLEHKSSIRDTMPLDLNWLAKITREAASKARHPAVAIVFTTENGKPVKFGSWVMMPESVFHELVRET
jgi:hypothetical protein